MFVGGWYINANFRMGGKVVLTQYLTDNAHLRMTDYEGKSHQQLTSCKTGSTGGSVCCR